MQRLVYRLHRERWSIRAIADKLGLSRMKVHQTLSADPDNDDERLALFAEDSDGLVPPFLFVGMDPPQGRQALERFVDNRGVSCTVLDIWRADRDEQGLSLGYLADATRQVDAAGYVRVSRSDGFWEWRRAGDPLPSGYTLKDDD